MKGDDDYVSISRIDNIGNDKWIVNEESGKEYCLLDKPMRIWTENGWSNIKYVMRHKVSKKMFALQCLMAPEWRQPLPRMSVSKPLR